MKVVANEDELLAHINRYSTMHSGAIVAEDTDACERFLDAVDASGRVRQRQHALPTAADLAAGVPRSASLD